MHCFVGARRVEGGGGGNRHNHSSLLSYLYYCIGTYLYVFCHLPILLMTGYRDGGVPEGRKGLGVTQW